MNTPRSVYASELPDGDGKWEVIVGQTDGEKWRCVVNDKYRAVEVIEISVINHKKSIGKGWSLVQTSGPIPIPDQEKEEVAR
jgi:hypothetical protein